MKVFNEKVASFDVDGKSFISSEDVKKVFNLVELRKGELGFHTPRFVRELYDPLGDYLSFSKLGVEGWAIVRLDESGIPINNFRWGEYYYPITIAHYGLQLYGKHVRRNKITTGRYMGSSGQIHVDSSSHYTNIKSTGKISDGFFIKDLHIDNLNELTIRSDDDFRVYIDINCVDEIKKICVYNGKGRVDDASEIKYISLNDGEVDKFYPTLHEYFPIKEIKVRGNVDLRIPVKRELEDTSEFLDKAIKIADWFVDNQDGDGAWVSDFEHHFFKSRTKPMDAGWPSALGQGLGISFLTRMFKIAKKDKYRIACEKALTPFQIDVEEGGVRRYWDKEKVFFEEYPTTPPSFVLNGFMFSVLGLYDCWKSLHNETAKQLFEDSFSTLLDILPLYDLGSHSAYDLTHYTCKSYPNVARWGYHQTHINQIYALEYITGSSQLKQFRKRWEKYMVDGYSCPLN
ncbi:D-glucuronyl C5-epimerase family protein [Cobetia sp. AM6]|uniref:D-glucuronyl C5-epimerase family protein n=1 Tax=Cobetia sp. AM6 TaxID=2661553 RepID=UPI0012994CB0|nr:D-glucuronyl C5-epimerase family protein [Cobetia sp. AM6]BBO56827.1 hypothetical protein CLAM6_21380 [Cobetia sp. AM6]